jgi:hypothetical protein
MLDLWNALPFGVLLVVNFLAGATKVIGGKRKTRKKKKKKNTYRWAYVFFVGTGDVVKDVLTYSDPATYAFSIWGVIYLCLTAFVFSTPTTACMGTWFAVACVMNSLWLITWGNSRWIISLGLIWSYVFVLFKILSCQSTSVTLFNVGHQIHFGWVLCAATVSVPLVVKMTFNKLISANITSLLLAIPPLVAWRLFPRMRYTHLAIVWALVAISQMQRKRKLVASKLVMRAALFYAALLVGWNILLYIRPLTATVIIVFVTGSA